MARILPSRLSVSEAWDAYAALCQAAEKDPQIAIDPGFQSARDRAHTRWSMAFVAWDGR